MKHRSEFRRVALLAGLVLVVGLLLSACGGSEGGLTAGDDAPGFSLEASSGGTVALADFEGHDVLLYFHMADG